MLSYRLGTVIDFHCVFKLVNSMCQCIYCCFFCNITQVKLFYIPSIFFLFVYFNLYIIDLC